MRAMALALSFHRSCALLFSLLASPSLRTSFRFAACACEWAWVQRGKMDECLDDVRTHSHYALSRFLALALALALTKPCMFGLI